jgi:hypothetical protein
MTGHDTATAEFAPFDVGLALVRRKRRHVAHGDFLMQRVTGDLVERLEAVSRPFAHAVTLHCGGPDVAHAIRIARPAARIDQIEAAHWPGQPDALVRPVEAFIDDVPPRHELAVSLLAMQGINDLPGFLVQARRLLKPDGLFLGCMLGAGTLRELREVLLQTEAEMSGGASPRVAPLADVRDVGGLLQRTGFALPVTDVDEFTVRHANLFALIADLRALGLTSALTARSRKPLGRAFWARAAEIYMNHHGDADGRIRSSFSVIWMSGWVPDPSQQKPLKPGSAKLSLKQALGASDG